MVSPRGGPTIRTRLALPFLFSVVLGCNDGTSPATGLKGAWTTGMVPSGAYTELYLAGSGQSISGTAKWQHGLSNGPLVAYTVAGRESYGTFTLTLTPDSGAVATYAGTLTEPGRLTGTWSTG